tara:strand:+ start:25090 stop:25662 length:573 start_codon:yes stop_codon:yes gene_type:complete
MAKFNLRRYKEARRGSEPPEAFLPQVWRGDPYDRTRHPGDGKGYNLVTPGNQGLGTQPPDISAPEFGRKWTAEGPDIPTAQDQNLNEDKAIRRNDTPSDWDPDDPFAAENDGDNRSTEYGQGLSTDYGQGLHDDSEPAADTALGLHSTVERMMNDDGRDRPTPFGNMQKTPHPFNASSRRSVFDRIRKHQ